MAMIAVTLSVIPVFAAAEAGVLPTSPLYFFDTLGESFALFFTPDPIDRARLQLEIAEERLAECEALPSLEKELWCPRLVEAYEEQMNSTFMILNVTRERSENLAGILINETERHAARIQSFISTAPLTVKPVLEKAINITQLAQPPPVRRVLIEEITRSVESPEVKERISAIVENATRSGNLTEAAQEEIKSAIQEEIRGSATDIENIVVSRIEEYIRERGTIDIRDFLEAFRRGLEG